MDSTTIQISMDHKSAGIEKHLTEYTKECWKIESKVARNSRGKLGFIMDHPEGHHKIQDKYKSKKFVVVGKDPEPNVYCIKPVNGSGPKQMVN